MRATGPRRLTIEIRLPTDKSWEERVIYRNIGPASVLRVLDKDLQELQHGYIEEGRKNNKKNNEWLHEITFNNGADSDWYVFEIGPCPGPAYKATELDTADGKVYLELNPEENRFVKSIPHA